MVNGRGRDKDNDGQFLYKRLGKLQEKYEPSYPQKSMGNSVGYNIVLLQNCEEELLIICVIVRRKTLLILYLKDE